MTIWEAIILGIIQGATEFLPVSSSGHLVLGQEFLGINLPGVTFEVALHLGTLASILLVYRDRIRRLVLGLVAGTSEAWRYLGLLAVASVPAAVVGVVFNEQVSGLFDQPHVVGLAFIATGLVLWSTRTPLRRGTAVNPPGIGSAVGIGLAQALAIIPGVSRSGSTVTAGLWSGVDPDEAAAFSFLMFIPVILGAALLEFNELTGGETGTAQMLLGTLAAALTGILAIKTFVAMLKQQSFHRFALYLWPLGAGFLLYLRR